MSTSNIGMRYNASCTSNMMFGTKQTKQQFNLRKPNQSVTRTERKRKSLSLPPPLNGMTRPGIRVFTTDLDLVTRVRYSARLFTIKDVTMGLAEVEDRTLVLLSDQKPTLLRAAFLYLRSVKRVRNGVRLRVEALGASRLQVPSELPLGGSLNFALSALYLQSPMYLATRNLFQRLVSLSAEVIPYQYMSFHNWKLE